MAVGGGHVMDRVVATFLTELDREDPTTTTTVAEEDGSGALSSSSSSLVVFCMGATNRPDLLDPALLRPGRLDRLVYLGVAASVDAQADILATQLRHLRLEGTGDAHEVAAAVAPHLPPHLTGADLSTIATGGLLRATERLCAEADRQVLELQQQQQQGEKDSNSASTKKALSSITVDQVLMSWGDDQLEPVVTLDDLLWAARKVVPSVSAAELANYERLGEQYRMGGAAS